MMVSGQVYAPAALRPEKKPLSENNSPLIMKRFILELHVFLGEFIPLWVKIFLTSNSSSKT
jgi:hypothetical protein